MTSVAARPSRLAADLRSSWLLLAAFAVVAIPTMITLAEQSWSREAGAHGPIVLATGAWLLLRQLPELRSEARPGHPVVTAILLIVSLPLYLLGSVLDFVTLQAGGVYGVGLAILNVAIGPRLMLKNWFPLFYLAFAVPPPTFVLDAITAPLKHFVSMAATGGLSAVGLPIERSGIIIYIAQYELLVEDACSGLNSLIGLTAISLFYIYLVRGSSVIYAANLTAFVIPIAIAANMVRIMVLVLITYFVGDQAAQGFAHSLAGVLLFVTALGLVFILDQLLFQSWRRLRRVR
jgi:exosortase